MPQGGTKPNRKHDFQSGTDIIAQEVDDELNRIFSHAQTDVPRGWFELVDSNGNSKGLEFVKNKDPYFDVQTSDTVDIVDMISRGMKIRIEQTTGGTKYGVITNIPFQNTSNKTQFEIYTFGNYVVENEVISNPVFTAQKNPHGWPAKNQLIGEDLRSFDGEVQSYKNTLNVTGENVDSSVEVLTETEDVELGQFNSQHIKSVKLTNSGTKLYFIQNEADELYEFDLSNAYELSSATNVNSYDIGGNDGYFEIHDIFIKPDGTKILAYDADTGDLLEYNLGTAYDVSTMTLNQTKNIDKDLEQGWIKKDGTRLIMGEVFGGLYDYEFSTAWDVSTISQKQTVNVNNEDTDDVLLVNSGKRLILRDSLGSELKQYELGTAYDVSSTTTQFGQPKATFDISPFVETDRDVTKITSDDTEDRFYASYDEVDTNTDFFGRVLHLSASGKVGGFLRYGRIKPSSEPGWIEVGDSDGNLKDLEFVSASAPVYTVQTKDTVDITNVISKGMKVRLDQLSNGSTKTKYGTIVDSPSVNGSSKTEFDILTTDTIKNQVISNPKFSTQYNPHGWDQPWPHFRAHLSTDQTMTNDTTEIVLLDAVRDDPYGFFDTANNDFTPGFSGRWSFKSSIFHHNGGGSSDIVDYFGEIHVNGSSKSQDRMDQNGSNLVITNITSHPSDDLNLNSGDRVELKARNVSSDGGNSNVLSNPDRTYFIANLESLFF